MAVPVTIIGRSDLEATGIDTNLLEVLQKRMPIFSGNGNLGVTNSNVGANSTYGGSLVSLRNLDTLVLLNGRRVPDNGANARGGSRFVDVNQFPIAAVRTIEVLTDGASAIYGSDAIGGVVNVKLRSDFNGVEAGARYAYSSRQGDYEEKSGYLVAGAKRKGFNLTAGGSWSKITPILQADRPFSTPITGRTATISGAVSPSSANFPTNVLRADLTSPSKAVPTGTAATAADLTALQTAGIYPAATFQSIADSFDLSPLVTLTLGSEKKGALLTGSMTLTSDIELFWDALYSKSDSFSQLAAQPVTSAVPVNAPYNPTRSALFAAFRYVPKPRQFYNTGELHRIVGGLRGKFLDKYQWEGAYNYGANKLTNELRNVLYNPNLQLALAGGYDANGNPQVGGKFARVFTNFGAPGGLTTLAQWQGAVTNANSVVQPAFDVFARPAGVDPASLVNVFGSQSLQFDSTLKTIDFKVSSDEVWQLPGGRLGAAVGIYYAMEDLKGVPDDNSRSSGPTAQRWNGATFFDPFTKNRKIKSAFAEVRVPIIGEAMAVPGFQLLDASAAYRYEDYSDAGKSRVPKYGLRWRPFGNDLTLRGTYAKGFTAPSLFSLFGPITQGFTSTAVIPNVFGVNGQAQSRSGSNSALHPSTGKTHSIGAVYSPKGVKGLTLSADYIHVDQQQLVGSAGSTEILRSVDQLGTNSPYAAQVAIGNWPTNPDPTLAAATRITQAGQLSSYLRSGNSANLIFLTDTRINIAGQKVRALDLSANYDLPWKDVGRWSVSTTGTFFLHYQFQALPSQSYYEYAGHVTNGGTGAEGVIPGMRWYSTISWNKGPWGATLGHTYIDKVIDLGPGGITFVSSTTLKRVPVASYSTADASLSYTFARGAPAGDWRRWLGGTRVLLGVNNLTDRMPPTSPQAYNESNADVSTYSPIGRLWYVSLQYKF